MDPAYRDSTEQVDVDAVLDGLKEWDDPAIGVYLERSHQAAQARIEDELARIDDQLAARDTLHDDLMTELEWHVKKYERELDRLATPFAPKTAAYERVMAGLQDLRQKLRNERRAHWQDRQRLERERRELLRERAALVDEDLSELL